MRVNATTNFQLVIIVVKVENLTLVSNIFYTYLCSTGFYMTWPLTL